MPANAAPKSIYKFPQYILGPRPRRTYLDDGSAGDPTSPINSLMLDLHGDTSDVLPVEEYKGLPDYVGERGFNTDPPPHNFSRPGAQLLSAGDFAAPMPPDMLNWRNAQPPVSAAPPPAVADDTGTELPEPLTSALDKEKGLYESYPERQTPKWWQRALGAAAGFGAGMANAGHIKRPIDIGAMEQNVLYPGYADKVAQWRSQMTPLQGQADIEGQRQAAALKAEQIGGQAESRLASADWRRSLADPHHNQQQLDPKYALENLPWLQPDKNGEFWVDKTVANTLSKPGPADRGMQVTDADIAKRLGVPVGSTVDRALYQAAVTAGSRPQNENQTALEVRAAQGDPIAIKALDDENKRHISVAQASRPVPDPSVIADREDRINERKQGALDKVGEQKIAKQNQVLQERRNEIAKIIGEGKTESEIVNATPTTPDEATRKAEDVAKIKAINRRYAPQLQAIEDQFGSAGSARGVPTQKFVVNPDTLEYKPAVGGGTAPAQSGARPQVKVGQPVMVGGKPAIVTGINPQTGKPIVKLQ